MLRWANGHKDAVSTTTVETLCQWALEQRTQVGRSGRGQISIIDYQLFLMAAESTAEYFSYFFSSVWKKGVADLRAFRLTFVLLAHPSLFIDQLSIPSQ